jgi:hypothetical protein
MINYSSKKLFIDWIASSEEEKLRSHHVATMIQWITGGIRYWRDT